MDLTDVNRGSCLRTLQRVCTGGHPPHIGSPVVPYESRSSLRDRILNGDRLTGVQAELSGRLLGRVLGHFEWSVEADPAGFEALEQHIERHDFC